MLSSRSAADRTASIAGSRLFCACSACFSSVSDSSEDSSARKVVMPVRNARTDSETSSSVAVSASYPTAVNEATFWANSVW